MRSDNRKPSSQRRKARTKLEPPARDFLSLKADYLNSAEMKEKAYWVKRLEREISEKRLGSPHHVANILPEIVDYPLTEAICDFLCDYLRGLGRISAKGYVSALDHAEMICEHIPAYEEKLKEFQHKPRKGEAARSRAIATVFKDMMEEENLTDSAIIERMRLARRFIEQNKLEHFLTEARQMDPIGRQLLTIDFMLTLSAPLDD